MTYEIRSATLSDLDSIMQVEQSAFIAPIQEKREIFASRIQNCPESFFVFQTDDPCTRAKKIFGYISAEFLPKEPTSSAELELNHTPSKTCAESLKSSAHFYISSFAILPQFRGCGLGKKLWLESLAHFENLRPKMNFYLVVNETWKGARAIYEKSGFVQTQIFENFFQTQNPNEFTNGILMMRTT